MAGLKVETWPIERLVPYCRNPRKNDEQVDRMASAIREFGFRIIHISFSFMDMICIDLLKRFQSNRIRNMTTGLRSGLRRKSRGDIGRGKARRKDV